MTKTFTASMKPSGWLLIALLIVTGSIATPPLHAKCADSLYFEITNRIAALGTASSTEKSALVKSKAALDKPALDLSAEVKALGTVATSLKKVTNSVIVAAEVGAAACYITQVAAQINTLSNRVATLPASGLKTAAGNQVTQAYTALDKANLHPADVSAVARNLGVALTKVTVGNQLAAKAEFAPASLHGKKVTVSVTNARGEHMSLTVTFVDSGYFIPPHGNENGETGTDSYTRTSVATAMVVLTSDPTQDNPSATTTINLSFTSATGGTLMGTSGGETFSGTFKVSNVKLDPSKAPTALSAKTILV